MCSSLVVWAGTKSGFACLLEAAIFAVLALVQDLMPHGAPRPLRLDLHKLRFWVVGFSVKPSSIVLRCLLGGHAIAKILNTHVMITIH